MSQLPGALQQTAANVPAANYSSMMASMAGDTQNAINVAQGNTGFNAAAYNPYGIMGGQAGQAGMGVQAQGAGNPANVGVTGGALQGGALNFGSAVGPNDYMGAYQNALNLNSSNYSNILSGYQQTANRQQTAQQAIEGGYGNLYNTVLGGIQGIGASQSQAIQDAYAQQSGTSAQQMINSGLGNTTVQQSVQRGNLLDEQKAQVALSNQLAQLQAGYQSNLGLAGLNYANQANMQNTALSGQQLNWMNSVSAPYPNAQAYGQLALQQGYANRAQQLYGQIPKGMGGGGGGLSVSGLNNGFGLGGAGSFNPAQNAAPAGGGGGGGSYGGGGGGAGGGAGAGNSGYNYTDNGDGTITLPDGTIFDVNAQQPYANNSAGYTQTQPTQAAFDPTQDWAQQSAAAGGSGGQSGYSYSSGGATVSGDGAPSGGGGYSYSGGGGYY